MNALLKGIFAGLIGAVIVSMLVHKTTGSSDGALGIHTVSLYDHTIFWSWPIFIVLAGLGAAIFKMME